MTRDIFIATHRAGLHKIGNRQMIADLVLLMDDESPARTLVKESPNDRLHGAAVYLNELYGWEKARALFASLIADEPVVPKEVPVTFAHPEIM